MFAGGRDYEEGPYNITIYEGQMSADYCINIINDTELELDETFTITINNRTAVNQGVILMDSYVARVTILDDECKYKIVHISIVYNYVLEHTCWLIF